MQAQDRGLRETLLLRDRGRERVSQARDTIAPLAGQILTRAREAGGLQPDRSGTTPMPAPPLDAEQFATAMASRRC